MDTAVVWSAATLALLLLGVVPSVLLAARGSNVQRLVGLQLLTGCSVMVLIGLSIVVAQSSYLIVPLVLAVLASIGTLVYTRLLKPGIDGQRVGEEE
ncbi:MrpF/PhaF family protein [Arthrobacter bambusae]|uniref:MrpF/PhaF family protein n=1 Tax=Arthrobacter bambusae TaxID=1338426 RepID=UPI002787B8D4|nr:MrpF/PhaF family protein [Arthrobacter bambusae]MDQ0028427.1 multisubunit Na+/H+ antiporter MnhF subunit [Arthrobacter bambusae]MDQ0096778.1 multisubunit Na+/H+ antiporter MnhF subunit [Arthrobacter bambusae]